MSIRDAYTNWSTSYDSDRNLTRDLDQAVTKDILTQYIASHQQELTQHKLTILELACGTGKNTTLLAQVASHVYALDFSEGMITRAKTKLSELNLSAKVTFTMADLTQPWPCAGQSIDLIVCNLVLEHIADLSFIFAEANRVLVKSGHFFISELHPFKQYQGKKANFQRGENQTEIAAFVHHTSDFTSAAQQAGLALKSLHEWWHEADDGLPPRIISFMFEK